MKNERGITLVALIITIIVMLILVGVTINVAINGGLIEKAREAATETEKRVIYDEIVTSMVVTNSGLIDPNETAEAAIALLEAEGRDVQSQSGTIVSIGVDGKYEYVITSTRIIEFPEYIDLDGLAAEMEESEELGEIGTALLEGTIGLRITWKDIGITNVITNEWYTNDDTSIGGRFKFVENSDGISLTVDGGDSIPAEQMLLMIYNSEALEVPEDNILSLFDGEVVFNIQGNKLTYTDHHGTQTFSLQPEA